MARLNKPVLSSQWAVHITPIPDKVRNQIVPRILVRISNFIFLSIKGLNKGVNRNRGEPGGIFRKDV